MKNTHRLPLLASLVSLSHLIACSDVPSSRIDENVEGGVKLYIIKSKSLRGQALPSMLLGRTPSSTQRHPSPGVRRFWSLRHSC